MIYNSPDEFPKENAGLGVAHGAWAPNTTMSDAPHA